MSAANHNPPTADVTVPVSDLHEYVESFGLFWEEAGLTRMAGRILSWLLICDPPHQTMHELTEALQASKSSISTSTRTLIAMGIVERLSVPGQRRDYYRVVPDSWSHIMEEKAKKQFTLLRQLSERGLALLEGTSSSRSQRLEEMREYYVFMEREFPLILDHWQAYRTAQLRPEGNRNEAGAIPAQSPTQSDGQGTK